MRVFPPADEFVLKKSALPALEAATKHVDIKWIKKNFKCRMNIVWMDCLLYPFYSQKRFICHVTFIVVEVKVFCENGTY